MPSSTFEENVSGKLTRIDYESSKIPHFALHSNTDDKVYIGIIDPALDESMTDIDLNFKGKEYDCRLKVIYSPESTGKREKYNYILLAISEVFVVDNERLNF